MSDQHQPTRPINSLLVQVEEEARIVCLRRSPIEQMLDSGELSSVRRGTARCIALATLRARGAVLINSTNRYGRGTTRCRAPLSVAAPTVEPAGNESHCCARLRREQRTLRPVRADRA